MDLRLARWHITAINFLLIGGIAYFAARSVNDFIARRLMSAPPAPAPLAAPRPAGVVHPRAYYDVIAKRDIFNLVPQPGNAAEAVVKAVDLHLQLLGTSLSTRREFAIIQDQGGHQSLYRVGDQIPGGGRLITVEKDRAIVRVGGRRVALELPANQMPTPASRVGIGLGRNPRFGRPPFIRGGPRPPIAPANDSEVSLDVDETGPNRYQLKRSQLREALSHTGQLMTEIRATPNVQNGKTDGVAISEVETGSVFEDLGLEDGDLLTSIDGRPLTNPLQAIGMLSSLASRSSVDLMVMRGGQPVRLHYDIR
jgi:general secretion pathway protein C